MRLLLDTNIIIPLINDKIDEIPEELAALVLDVRAERMASVVVFWEMAIKNRLGKLPLPCRRSELPELVAFTGVRMLPVTIVHSVTDVDPWPDTNDPFDRLMLAVCKSEKLQLVTTDRTLRDHPLAWRP
jgi:PIN domain nuclease of toxin-antitoxin system